LGGADLLTLTIAIEVLSNESRLVASLEPVSSWSSVRITTMFGFASVAIAGTKNRTAAALARIKECKNCPSTNFFQHADINRRR
jgi:hypothetical protein